MERATKDLYKAFSIIKKTPAWEVVDLWLRVSLQNATKDALDTEHSDQRIRVAQGRVKELSEIVDTIEHAENQLYKIENHSK